MNFDYKLIEDFLSKAGEKFYGVFKMGAAPFPFPELLARLDEAIKKDKQYSWRNDFIEDCILRYLESKGKI